MEDLRRQFEAMLARVAALEAELARTQAALVERETRIVELEAQVAELTVELQRRKKGFRPKANAISRPKKDKDGRAKGERKHPGVVRRPVEPSPDDIVHDLRSDACPECGGSLEETGEYIEHTVEDIPPPQVEVHRYRRHRQRCACCRKVTVKQAAVVPGVVRACWSGLKFRGDVGAGGLSGITRCWWRVFRRGGRTGGGGVLRRG